MLNIQKLIQEKGIDEATSELGVEYRDYGHKIILAYNQLESDFDNPATHECRGLVLEKETLNVMSFPLYKFFNAGEKHAATLDWSSVSVLKKYDGTMIHIYYDWIIDDWCVATTRTANAEGASTNFSSFESLFKYALERMGLSWNSLKNEKLQKGYTYVFELCTPYNIIVTPHPTSQVYLLTIRDLFNNQEQNLEIVRHVAEIDLGVYPPASYDLLNRQEVEQAASNLPFDDEGYVVVDKNFDRVKIKNPAYVATHHLTTSQAEWRIMDIVKQGEVEEFIACFPERQNEIRKLENYYNWLVETLERVLEEVYHTSEYAQWIDKPSRKPLALWLKERLNREGLISWMGIIFSILDGKNSKSIKQQVREQNSRDIYKFLKSF